MLIFFVPRILLPVLHRAETMKPYCAMHTSPKNKSLIRAIQIARSAGSQQHKVNHIKCGCKKVPKKKGCDLAKKQDSSLFFVV